MSNASETDNGKSKYKGQWTKGKTPLEYWVKIKLPLPWLRNESFKENNDIAPKSNMQIRELISSKMFYVMETHK